MPVPRADAMLSANSARKTSVVADGTFKDLTRMRNRFSDNLSSENIMQPDKIVVVLGENHTAIVIDCQRILPRLKR